MSKEFVDGVIAFVGGVGGAAILLAPGYVVSKVFSRGVRGPDLSDPSFIATTALGAILTHVLALAWTLELFRAEVGRFPDLERSDYLWLIAWTVLTLLLLPTLIGAAFAWILDAEWRPANAVLHWLGISSTQRTTEAWTWAFGRLSRRRDRRWLQIRLKNDRSYLAAFGSASFISSDARLGDVYLEQIWDLDETGEPKERPTTNHGAWISGDQISSIEFFPFPREHKPQEEKTK